MWLVHPRGPQYPAHMVTAMGSCLNWVPSGQTGRGGEIWLPGLGVTAYAPTRGCLTVGAARMQVGMQLSKVQMRDLD